MLAMRVSVLTKISAVLLAVLTLLPFTAPCSTYELVKPRPKTPVTAMAFGGATDLWLPVAQASSTRIVPSRVPASSVSVVCRDWSSSHATGQAHRAGADGLPFLLPASSVLRV
jgi:hypothetical protein